MEQTLDFSPNRTPLKANTKGWFYATGRRKSSVARVWIKPGTGKFSVNNQLSSDYFFIPGHQAVIQFPLKLVECLGQYDIQCTVKGGGLSGQAGAVSHGLSCVLAGSDLTLRPALKKKGCLTRDARRVERKKPGQPKARKHFQFSKR
jgi:small subunit ribosomal protein S9